MYLIHIHNQDNPEQVVDRLSINNLKQYKEYWESYQKTYPGKITGYELKDMFIPERKIDNKIQGTSYKTKKSGLDQLTIEKILEEIMTLPLNQHAIAPQVGQAPTTPLIFDDELNIQP
jgi:hypothetical protein